MTPRGAGSGTEEDPYVITNVYELQEMADGLGACYVLGNDIDAEANPIVGIAIVDPSDDSLVNSLDTEHGSVRVDSDLVVTYVAREGYWGEDTFTYRISDREDPLESEWSNGAEVQVHVQASPEPQPVEVTLYPAPAGRGGCP